MPAAWEVTRDQKRAARDALIPAEFRLPRDHPIWERRKHTTSDIDVLENSGLLTEEDKRITSMSASALAAAIASKQMSSETVVKAFVKRASYAHQLSNLLTEINFTQALERARELDRIQQNTGKTVGPLHGVPMSIKDNFAIKGFDSSVGFLSPPFVNAPQQDDAVVVKLLRDAGACIIAKTNIPQLMMSLEPVNPLWGRSTNPHNRNVITGGSSSGEGGLVAARGSPLGIGTDIGGSIRGPSAFNGIYGIKPTSMRVPLLGTSTLIGGQESIRSVGGPMGSSVEDLDLAMRVILGGKPWEHDPFVVNVGWREEEKRSTMGRKLTVGYFLDNGFYRTTPANERAILETVAALRAMGHTCIEVLPPRVGELQALSSQIFNSHGYLRLKEYIDKNGDPLERFTAYQMSMSTTTKQALLEKAQKTADKYPDDSNFREQVLAGARGPLSADEVYRLNILRNQISKEWLEMWSKHNLDCVLSETLSMPAMPEWKFTEAAFSGTGTGIYNVLDFPGGVIPVSKVIPAIDGPATNKPRWKGESDINKLWNECREKMAGAPVCVQLVTRRFEDEKLIGVMYEVDRSLKEWKKGGKARI